MPYRKPWIESQAGQAIVLIAFMMIALLAGVGLAVDAGVGYYYNTSAERAAAAAALAGVIFMPNQFGGAQANGPDTSIPAGAGSDASDRAVNEARKNGFDIADAVHNVRVIPAPVPGASNKLQVTVSRDGPDLLHGDVRHPELHGPARGHRDLPATADAWPAGQPDRLDRLPARHRQQLLLPAL